MYITAILLAAGKGLRLNSKIPKPLIKINSRPLIIYSLDMLSRHPNIKDIVVVANRNNLQDIRNKIRHYRINKIKDIVLGGRLRQDSVFKGLKATDTRADMVLIHDGGRPFIDKAMVSSIIRAAEVTGAAIVGVPVKATIKEVYSSQLTVHSPFAVRKTLNRANLWEIQTPQVFKRGLILKAYKKFAKVRVTDDAMLIEKLGVKVSLVLGNYRNIKVTTPEDLILAEAIAKNFKNLKVSV